MRKAEYAIGQRVSIRGKQTPRVVHCGYPVEIWMYYELGGLEGYLVREDLLEPLEPSTAPGYVPMPMAQGRSYEQRHIESENHA